MVCSYSPLSLSLTRPLSVSLTSPRVPVHPSTQYAPVSLTTDDDDKRRQKWRVTGCGWASGSSTSQTGSTSSHARHCNHSHRRSESQDSLTAVRPRFCSPFRPMRTTPTTLTPFATSVHLPYTPERRSCCLVCGRQRASTLSQRSLGIFTRTPKRPRMLTTECICPSDALAGPSQQHRRTPEC